MFYIIKVSNYIGWHYIAFQKEKDALKEFDFQSRNKEFLGKRVQLFKMQHAHTNAKYPIFIPTYKYINGNWIKIKKNYQKEYLK